MGDKEAQPNVTTHRTVGMSGGFNKNGTVIGRQNAPEQMAMRSTHTEGMSGGRNEGGTVIGENNGEVYTPGTTSNTTIEDSHSVTAVNGVTDDTVERGAGGAGPSIDGRGVQVMENVTVDDLDGLQ